MIDATMRPLGKLKIDATPIGIDEILGRAERARNTAQLERTVVAFEPTSHYWMQLVKGLEDRGVDYLVVHPISVWRGREIRDYGYAERRLQRCLADPRIHLSDHLLGRPALVSRPAWARSAL